VIGGGSDSLPLTSLGRLASGTWLLRIVRTESRVYFAPPAHRVREVMLTGCLRNVRAVARTNHEPPGVHRRRSRRWNFGTPV